GPADAAAPDDPRISGANMGVHSPAFGLALARKLEASAVPSEILIAPDAGRTFHDRALAFLRKHVP
ncbi:MAG: hypothetical protein ACRD44_18480, partial [Bryobacteraceae bacterium]